PSGERRQSSVTFPPPQPLRSTTKSLPCQCALLSPSPPPSTDCLSLRPSPYSTRAAPLADSNVRVKSDATSVSAAGGRNARSIVWRIRCRCSSVMSAPRPPRPPRPNPPPPPRPPPKPPRPPPKPPRPPPPPNPGQPPRSPPAPPPCCLLARGFSLC